MKFSAANAGGITLLALATVAVAAPPATQPATQPTTQPAVDRSTPEKTWAGICIALKAGDLASFRAGFYNRNALAQEFMETYSAVTVATFDLARAITLLGKPGRQMEKKFEAVYTETVHNGEHRKLIINGDNARWVHAQKPGPGVADDVICFKHIKGQWLIDTVETYDLDSDAGREGAERLIASVPKVTATLKAVAADIRAQKITTVDQMRQRLAGAGSGK